MELIVNGIQYSYEAFQNIKDISINVSEQEFVGIIGPNGSGKSTLLNCAARILPAYSGSITLDSRNIQQYSHKEFAQKVGVMSQENELPFHFCVHEIVSMGRSPYKKMFEWDDQKDQEKIDQALHLLGIQELKEQYYHHISGGEKQRVVLARTIAQDTSLILLDEPTNHLDIYYQLEIFKTLKKMKVSILAAVHDLNIAANFCDRIYVLHEGAVFVEGKPEEVLTEEIIQEVFQVEATIIRHPKTNKIQILFS